MENLSVMMIDAKIIIKYPSSYNESFCHLLDKKEGREEKIKVL